MFRKPKNPSGSDLVLTNRLRSFLKIVVIEVGYISFSNHFFLVGVNLTHMM